jgi:hypothetical protein
VKAAQYALPESLFVLCLLLLAAGLRLFGVAHGQPPADLFPTWTAARGISPSAAIHPDEFLYVSYPLRMGVSGQLNSKFFENPSFLINLNFFTFWLTGAFDGRDLDAWAAAGMGDREIASFDLYVIARVYSALGGVVAAAAAYAAARRLNGRAAAACAGLLVAVAFPLVQHGHYATTSSLAAGFAALSVWAGVMSATTDGRRALAWFALAGAAAGMAAGCRYNAAGVALINLGIGVLLLRRGAPPIGVLAGWLAIPTAFVLTTPHVLFDFPEVWADFLYIIRQYGAGESTFSTPYGLAYELRYLALYGLGLPACALAVIGVLRAFTVERRARGVWVALLVYLLAYALVVLRTTRPAHADQLILPVLPVLALCAGAGWEAAARRVRTMPLRAALLAAVAAMPLTPTVEFLALLRQPDTRYTMAAWVSSHLPRGTHIHLNGPYNLPLDPAWYTMSQNFGGQYPTIETVIEAGAQYVVISDAWAFDVTRQRAITGDEVVRDLMTYYSTWERRLIPLAHIGRVRRIGDIELPNASAVWHHPALTVYAVRDD